MRENIDDVPKSAAEKETELQHENSCKQKLDESIYTFARDTSTSAEIREIKFINYNRNSKKDLAAVFHCSLLNRRCRHHDAIIDYFP